MTLPRILIIHNAYQQRGGEDTVVESEMALLSARGHDVELFARDNHSIVGRPSASLALQALWSTEAGDALAAKLNDFKPDVLHVHNTMPLISPSIYWVAHRMRVPVVQTLHNFRLLCPQAMLLRDQRVCEDCVGKVPWRSVLHRCYRDSAPQSAVLAGMITLHRGLGTWRNKVTRYIALNDFCRRKFIEGGLPEDRIVIKPNFVDFDAPPDGPRSGFLYVGRLSTEKGVATLAEASKRLAGCELRVAGSGPLADTFDGSPAVMLGSVGMDEVRRQMQSASALVLPSIWFESFPRTLVEAFACGLPVIASRLGALAELIEDGKTGLLFEPGNVDSLVERLQWAREHPQELAEMGRNARACFEAHFTPQRNYEQLLAIYQTAIAEVCGAAATPRHVTR